MDERSAQMAEQLRRNPAMLKSLMQSQDGQTLMRLLTQGDGGTRLKKKVRSAAKGDTAAVAQMVSQIMRSPEGAALVERINQAVQK